VVSEVLVAVSGIGLAPRLTERLTEGMTRKLMLVSAPAGFGKTMPLSEWASHFGLATE
jgi:ATP/maltotriose-dependent transcriptional regulator MalT